jgi:hypothetical protein
MPSSVIRSFDYDDVRNELTVALMTGRVYVYSLVPPALVAEFKAAFSKGRFYNARIRGEFPYREVTEDDGRGLRRASTRNISRNGGSRHRG